MRRSTRTTVLTTIMTAVVASAGLVLGGGCFGAIHGASTRLERYPERPGFSRSAADLERFVAKWSKGYTRRGKTIHGQLEKFQPVNLTLRRGYCYLYVLRLKPGAQFSATARKGLDFNYRKLRSGTKVSSGPGVHGPGAVLSAGCPLATELATFSGRMLLAQLSGQPADELGRGGYTLQLYVKPIGHATLAHLSKDRARQIQESREFKRRQAQKKLRRQRQGCAVCHRKYQECLADWRRGARRSTCRKEYRSCVFVKAGLASPSMCR